jgi:S-adenosylmethionine synthetase
MNKIITLLVSIIISLSIINPTNAGTLENKLYKWVIVTKTQIEKDYNASYNTKIETIFIKFRYYKDRTTLNKLEALLKERIINLNTKEILSRSERKMLNLYNNLYYRTKLLLDYQL